MLINFNFFTSWYWHFQWVWLGMSKVPRQACNIFMIFQKEVRNEVNFGMHHVSIKDFNKLIPSFWWVQSGIPKVPKIVSLQYLRNDMLDYLDIWYVIRTPSHTQSMQNNSTISQEWDARLSWFLYWKIKVKIGGPVIMFPCWKKSYSQIVGPVMSPKWVFFSFTENWHVELFWFLAWSYISIKA